jgi:nucleoside-diphosphate-sugar epimerase
MIVVTGGSGFIGSHLLDELAKKHDTIYNLDKSWPGLITKKARSRITPKVKDISQEDWELEIEESETVYHLAAKTWSKVEDHGRWIRDSHAMFATNVMGTHNLLRFLDTDLIVFTSTANVYGEGRMFKEKSPFKISSPYGYTKALAERVIEASGIPHVIFRFGTTVGPRGRCFPNRLVWSAINGKTTQVFNMGETYRDFIDVRDVVGVLEVAKKLPSGIYNVASEVETSGKKLAETVASIAEDRGYSLDYELVDFSPGGFVSSSTLDISKILDTGSWTPRIGLETMLKSLFDYYEKPGFVEPPDWRELE